MGKLRELLARLLRTCGLKGLALSVSKENQPDREVDNEPDAKVASILEDGNEVDAAAERADLLFATSPLLPVLMSIGHTAVPPLAADYARLVGFGDRLDSFLGELRSVSSVDIDLRSELQIFVRAAFTYPARVDEALAEPIRKAAFAGRLGLTEDEIDDLARLVAVARLTVVADDDDELVFYDDLDNASRADVERRLDELASAGEPRLVEATIEPRCSDDVGSGRTALIHMAFGRTAPLAAAADLTEPERWPSIFPQAWISVERSRPWEMTTYANPAITGRTSRVVERVSLPAPLNEPVLLDVTRIQHRASVAGEPLVSHRALVYSLAAPHKGLTEDTGILYQATLGADQALADAPWYGLTLKRLGYRNTTLSGLTQLVCFQWLRMIRMAIS